MDDRHDKGVSRRFALECMTWAGTGLLWTVAGGVPTSKLIGQAKAAESGFSFAQISDSHIGFSKPANPDTRATLAEAMDRVSAMKERPAFLIHTGDITHLAKPQEFDDAEKIIRGAKIDVHYVPGEHDMIDEGVGKAYLARYGKKTQGKGWYSFDQQGVHFIGLVNVSEVVDGMGHLGPEQLAWLQADLKGKSASTPIVVFAHIPLWAVYADWGWTTDDGVQALEMLKRFGSVTVLNGHIHQIFQKVEGNVAFHTARSTAFPQGTPGKAPAPGPMLMPEGKLRTALGVTSVVVKPGEHALAITDTALAS
ncbi:MAG TPA: metallophosphoesterase [Rhodoblastus sp.]|nr:metallophosphoesterase [Rhodoblastus sp.]